MTQNDYDEYAEGYQSGEEAAEETGLSGVAQRYVEDVWTGRNDAKSEVWWKGFHDGEDGTWDPPEEEAGQESEPAGEGGTLRRNR
jgi:hypothetical protein